MQLNYKKETIKNYIQKFYNSLYDNPNSYGKRMENIRKVRV